MSGLSNCWGFRMVNRTSDRNRFKLAGGQMRVELFDQIGSHSNDLVLVLDDFPTRLGPKTTARPASRTCTC